VRVAGAGIDVTVPVGENGWWLGIAELPEPERLPDLPEGQDRAYVVATSFGPDGQVLGQDPLMVITVRKNSGGGVTLLSIGFI
jgi:leucyl aminopeptidase (aminopeptidase T)